MKIKTSGLVVSAIMAVAVIGVILTLGQTDAFELNKYAVSSQEVFTNLQNDEPVLIVDIRSANEYQAGHMDGAAHDDYSDPSTLEKRVTTIQKRLPEVASTHSIVLVDDDVGIRAKQAAQSMTEMGIKTFYLADGMDVLSEDITHTSQTTIDSEELMLKIAANEDLYLLDVREPDELLESKIDGAVNIPLAEIFQPNGMDNIPTDRPVVVICGSGNRATIATYALAQEDIDFQILEGGMKAWNSHIQE